MLTKIKVKVIKVCDSGRNHNIEEKGSFKIRRLNFKPVHMTKISALIRILQFVLSIVISNNNSLGTGAAAVKVK